MISASVMCADLCNLEKDIKELERAGVKYLHFDIMDGSFVPNYSMGTDLLDSVRSITKIPFDIHFMVEKPELKIEYFDIREGDIVSIHYESTVHLSRLLQKIKEKGAVPALAINPATPINNITTCLDEVDIVLIMTVNPGFAKQKLVNYTLNKIVELKDYLTENGYSNVKIEVDGNVSYKNAGEMKKAGADIFVAGTSSIFNKNCSIMEGVDLLGFAIS